MSPDKPRRVEMIEYLGFKATGTLSSTILTGSTKSGESKKIKSKIEHVVFSF